MFDEELRLAPQIPETRLTLLQRLPDAEDAAAWSAFVDLYGPVILSFSLSRGCPVSDAADLLQEVLVIVARKIRSFEFDPVRGRFRTWLLAIVKYKLIDRIRRQSVRPDVVGDAGNNWRLDSLADPSADPDELWEMEYRRQLVLRALPKLQSQFHGKTWEAFRKTAMEDGNPTEVARELGMSLGAVYIAKSRVLAKLREQVERLNHEWEPGLPSSRLRFGR
ncbi:MAG: RNA polymerase sigma factor [Verrucomicrobiae bacterium]|nr:RNA polymerase sigma factor [Verrucomicrobiae bacterium]